MPPIPGAPIGIITNAAALADELLERGCANFETMSSGAINSAGLIGAIPFTPAMSDAHVSATE